MTGRGTDSSWTLDADACAPNNHAIHVRLPRMAEEYTMNRFPESVTDNVGETRGFVSA